MRSRAFFYHFNRPASQKTGTVKLSVHSAGQCHIVDAIDCRVPSKSRTRKTQPRVVMAGKGRVIIQNGMAIITGE